MKKIIVLLLSINFYFTQGNADQLLEKGKEIFLNQGNCSSCHTLSDAKSDGSIGPNLNEIIPTKERVLAAVTRGIGVMPAYDGILTSEEIDAVAHYVSTVSQQ